MQTSARPEKRHLRMCWPQSTWTEKGSPTPMTGLRAPMFDDVWEVDFSVIPSLQKLLWAAQRATIVGDPETTRQSLWPPNDFHDFNCKLCCVELFCSILKHLHLLKPFTKVTKAGLPNPCIQVRIAAGPNLAMAEFKNTLSPMSSNRSMHISFEK